MNRAIHCGGRYQNTFSKLVTAIRIYETVKGRQKQFTKLLNHDKNL